MALFPSSKEEHMEMMYREKIRDMEQRYSNKLQEMYRQLSYQSVAPTMPATPKPLSAQDATDLITQQECDGVLIKNRKLLFGTHMNKDLRHLPNEYLVSLGCSLKQLRREIAREMKRRWLVERVTKP